jgi:hypothetical protein
MTLNSVLERLSNYRIRNTRASRDIFNTSFPLFEQNGMASMGDESALSLQMKYAISPLEQNGHP